MYKILNKTFILQLIKELKNPYGKRGMSLD